MDLNRILYTYQIKLKFIVRIPHDVTIGIVYNEAKQASGCTTKHRIKQIRSTFYKASQSPD